MWRQRSETASWETNQYQAGPPGSGYAEIGALTQFKTKIHDVRGPPHTSVSQHQLILNPSATFPSCVHRFGEGVRYVCLLRDRLCKLSPGSKNLSHGGQVCIVISIMQGRQQKTMAFCAVISIINLLGTVREGHSTKQLQCTSGPLAFAEEHWLVYCITHSTIYVCKFIIS